jgi:hypothetical protein
VPAGWHRLHFRPLQVAEPLDALYRAKLITGIGDSYSLTTTKRLRGSPHHTP